MEQAASTFARHQILARLAYKQQFELQRLCPKMFDFYSFLLFLPFMSNVLGKFGHSLPA